MTKEEIIEMARQAGFSIAEGIVTGGVTDVKRFAKLVAELEREACAKVAEEYANGLERNYSEIIADQIRARGQA
jgi:hypothetical protein